jgi:hypothetical protein
MRLKRQYVFYARPKNLPQLANFVLNLEKKLVLKSRKNITHLVYIIKLLRPTSVFFVLKIIFEMGLCEICSLRNPPNFCNENLRIIVFYNIWKYSTLQDERFCIG